MNYSTTQSGNLLVIASCVSMILGHFNVHLLPEEIALVLTAAGVAISWYGRWKKGDITVAGFYK